MPSAPDEQLRQMLTLGRGFFEKRQFPEAERYLSQVVERSQSFADVYNMLGTIYHDQGQYARAQRVYDAALKRSSKTPGALDPFVKGKIANMYAEIGDVLVASA